MLSTETLKAIILENAKEVARLHAAVHAECDFAKANGVDRRDADSPLQVWREFQARYDSLAFPGGYRGALERIAAGDAEATEAGICFLELRPFFFRSGYMFKDILRKCRHAPLNEDQSSRLKIVEEKLREWSLREGPLSRQLAMEGRARQRRRHKMLQDWNPS